MKQHRRDGICSDALNSNNAGPLTTLVTHVRSRELFAWPWAPRLAQRRKHALFWKFFILFGLPDPPLLRFRRRHLAARRPPGWNWNPVRGLCRVRQELAWFKPVR